MASYAVGDIINEVLVGYDGELYLATGNHMPLSFLTGQQTISQEAVDNFLTNLVKRKAIATEVGALYCHMVAPDKHTVVRDSFPLDGFTTPGERLYEISQDFLFPRNELTTLLAEKRAYQKVDSHWTVWGAIKAFEIMFKRFGLEQNDVDARITEVIDGILIKNPQFSGDLGRKLPDSPTEPFEAIKARIPHKIFTNGFTGNNGKLVGIKSRHPKAKGRFLAFGDSFLMLFPPIFAYIFEETILCRTPFMHKEVVQALSPDYVLTEAVERYLPKTVTDEMAPTFIHMQEAAASVQALGFTDEGLAFFGSSLVPPCYRK